MTFDTPEGAPHLAERSFVLATDLDGTFLGGSEADRRALYDWIEDNRESVGLIFVTGRDPAFIKDLCTRQGVPMPEYAVGDVGTTIARLDPDGTVQPIPELEAEIAATWGDAGDKVRRALDGVGGLTLQPTPFRYRVSYDMDPDRLDPMAKSIVDGLGHDVLISDDRFFDVLPRGVSKGPSLRRLVRHLGIEEHRLLAAGDTMNDLSMLSLGLPAVAVGGAETALLEAVAEMDHLHRASAIGAAGIAEAIRVLNLHPNI